MGNKALDCTALTTSLSTSQVGVGTLASLPYLDIAPESVSTSVGRL